MSKKFFQAWFISLIFILVLALAVSAQPNTSLDDTSALQSSGQEIFIPFIKSKDNTPPTVSPGTPINGAVGVDIMENIVLQFSEAIQPDTITSSNLILRNSSNIVIPSVLNYDSILYRVTINPNSSLSFSATYNMTVYGGVTGIKDMAGNIMSGNFSLSFTTGTDPSPTGAIIADHTRISSFGSIPSGILQAAAAIKTLFMHQSTGNNIDFLGFQCLAGLHGDPENYPQECITYALNPYSPYDNRNWNWQEWAEPMADAPGKTDEWVSVVNAQQQNYQVLGMKFCYVDGWNQDFEYYKSKMEQLEQTYSQKTIIWTTSVLWAESEVTINLASAENIQSFNQQVRAYARANNKVLYDLADIESHDPNGNSCQSNGIEALCDAYYTGYGGGGGGHPDINGSIWLAKGFWWLMARISGWNGN